MEKLRSELLSLCDNLKEGDLDENVRHLRYMIENFSKLAIKQMKENVECKEAVVDIKRRLPSPTPPQPERVESADMAKKEPGSPSGTTPAEESKLSLSTFNDYIMHAHIMHWLHFTYSYVYCEEGASY